MGILLDLLNLAVYIPILKVNEEDIGRNIKHLKQHQWFQSYLNDEKYRELIIYNKDGPESIGKFNRNKLEKQSYLRKCEEKLQQVLLKKHENIS